MNLEQRLRESLVAPDPGASFTARVMARVRPGRSRRRGRFVLIGTFVAVAAAAAMLVWRLSEVQPPLPVVAAIPAMPVTDAGSAAAPPATQLPPVAGDPLAEAPAVKSSLPALPLAASPQYSVLVMPLRHQAQDPAGRHQVEAFYSSVIEELRKVTGLMLQMPGGSADHVLTITSLGTDIAPSGNLLLRSTDGTRTYTPGRSPSGVDRDYGNDPRTGRQEPGETRSFEAAGRASSGSVAWIEMKVESRAAPAAWYTFPIAIEGPAGQGQCAASGARLKAECLPPAPLAARQVEKLRMQVFPPDAALQQAMVRRLGDASLAQEGQLQVLQDLLLLEVQPPGATHYSGSRLDGAALRALVERAPTLPAVVRAQIWMMLRHVPRPELVRPLVDSLRRDADRQVRLEALRMLTANFAADPAVRAALEDVAQQDADDTVRIAARRELHGPLQLRSDVLELLDNTDLPYANRLAPLRAFASDMLTSRAQDLQQILQDRQLLQKLVDLVRQHLGDSSQSQVNMEVLVLLSNIRDPLVTDLFNEARRHGLQSPVFGSGAIRADGLGTSGSIQGQDAPFVPSDLLDRIREVTEAARPAGQ